MELKFHGKMDRNSYKYFKIRKLNQTSSKTFNIWIREKICLDHITILKEIIINGIELNNNSMPIKGNKVDNNSKIKTIKTNKMYLSELLLIYLKYL
jgi:hypothetical protein